MDNLKKIVFLGEKSLSLLCLQYLRSLNNVEIIAVCTRALREVWWEKQEINLFCKENDIPIVKRTSLAELEYDYLISVLYPFIIEKQYIEKTGSLAINLHEAPLPRWRGCNGCSHAILQGDRRYGTTLHLLDEQLDAGDVIATRQFPIKQDETAKELYNRTKSVSLNLFKKWIPKIFIDDFQFYPQSEKEAAFVNSRDSLKKFKELPGDMDILHVFDSVRALDFLPWEPAFYTRNDLKYYLYIGDSVDRIIEITSNLSQVKKQKSLSELDLNIKQHIIIGGFNRPLVICDEITYNDIYNNK